MKSFENKDNASSPYKWDLEQQGASKAEYISPDIETLQGQPNIDFDELLALRNEKDTQATPNQENEETVEVYNQFGNYVTTTGNPDKAIEKRVIALSKSTAKAIKKGASWKDFADVITLPSEEVMNTAQEAIDRTQSTSVQIEQGFVVGIDGTTSEIVSDGENGKVKMGPAYEEMEKRGVKTAFDVHTHPEGEISGESFKSTHYPSGEPESIYIDKDFGYRGLKERQKAVTEPSWVLGERNEVKYEKRENQVAGPGERIEIRERYISFYTSKGIVGEMTWEDFKAVVDRVNKKSTKMSKKSKSAK
ncbi:hypothetical protein [Persicobacter sp. CCB-QB2]|uniref:hypothetical protein n=1 Tax=Persicobacter sp. CCB-QB2 TaxID=1561025 RepID=UPI0006A9F453|nr:hypothetical protein [Persicobacter sp. CCB-QB2]